MTQLPTGTVTFVFVEIEDAAQLLVEHGQDRFVECLGVLDGIVRKAIDDDGGVVVNTEADSYFAVFRSAPDAVTAAAAIQRAIESHEWPGDTALRSRIGMHTGAGVIGGDDYVGLDVHRAARIAAAAHGGQVLLSATTAAVVQPVLAPDISIRDLGEHRLKDLEPEPLHQLVVAGLQADFPPLRAAGPAPNNLPKQATSFVGRDEDIQAVTRLITDARFVTLSGVAGSGKTRLALRVAEDLREAFPDGMWFVDLSTVQDPRLVDAEIAHALNLREHPGSNVRDTVVAHLKDMHALVILDNCEHMIEAASHFVSALMAATTTCKVLSTSRELLRVAGEVAYRVGPLGLPLESEVTDPAAVAMHDAARLFVARARSIDPSFALTAETTPAVAEICTRLDGMPLAIELAAAQLRTFSPGEIAQHLDQHLQTFESSSESDDPRQHSLATAIDWSYQLLTERQRALFERLSVFRGGFDLNAAQSVCAGGDIDPLDVFGLVVALADKSLLVADVGGSTSRYRLLEMLRQFASEKLTSSGDRDALRERHAAYYLDFAETAEPHIRGADEREWWGRIADEMDNMLAAMEWSVYAARPEVGLRIAGALWRYWRVAFRFSFGVQCLRDLLGVAEDADDAVRAKAQLGLGTLLGYSQEPAAAMQLLAQSVDTYRSLDAQGTDPEVLRSGYAAALVSLATQMWRNDEDDEGATALWTEALDVAQRVQDLASESAALGNLAEAAAKRGDIEAARVGYRSSIEATRLLGSTVNTVESIMLSAVFEMSIDEPARAIDLLDQAVEMAREALLPLWGAFSLAMRSVAALDAGDADAETRFNEAVARLYGDPKFTEAYYYQMPIALGRADFYYRAGRLQDAAASLGVLEALEERGSPLEPIFEGRRRERLVNALTNDLGHEGFAAAVDRGRTLTDQEVTRLIARR